MANDLYEKILNALEKFPRSEFPNKSEFVRRLLEMGLEELERCNIRTDSTDDN